MSKQDVCEMNVGSSPTVGLKKLMKNIFFIIFFTFTQLFLSATNSLAIPSIQPLFHFEEIFSKDELSPQEIITAAIEFSEVDSSSPEGTEIFNKYLALEKIVTSQEFVNTTEKERASKILTLMYETTLSQYIENQTKLTTMFQNGTYNCVSSSILYMALAKACGLRVVPQKTPSHAFCSVYINNEKIDVETTNPYGFNPGTKHELESQHNQKKYAIIPKIKYQNRTEISQKNLVSLIAANLYGAYLKKNNFTKAIPLALSRMNYLQTESEQIKNDARNDLDIIFTNYTIVLENKNQYETSLNFLQNCINTVGTTQKLTDTYSLSLYNAIVYELNNKNITISKNLFNTHKDNIFSEYQIKINEMIYIEELQKELENTTATQALELLDNTENQIIFTQKQNINRINSLKEFFWIELINQESEKQNYIQAAKIAENAISKMPNNQNLKRIKNQCLKNHGITIHNKIVPLVNSKNYSQAIKILEEGLKENPNSIEIKNDLNRLKKFAY